MPKLSVLIPTIATRGLLLTRILDILRPQLTAEVEVLVNLDTCARTIGEKRNSMLHSAEGEYVVQVDDDDTVSGDYVAQLMTGINKGVDVVSIRGEVFKDDFPYGVFIDTPYQKMATERRDGVQTFLRGVQHLDAIKREIALEVPFESRMIGEDSRWTEAIHNTGLVKTWYQIEVSVYQYLWVTSKPRYGR